MPLLTYLVTGQIVKPLDLPGARDCEGNLEVRVSSADLRAGRGKVIVSGTASSSLSKTPLEIERIEGTFADGVATIEINRPGKVAGVVAIHILAGWEKAQLAAVVTPQRGLAKGQKIEAAGEASLAEVEVWESSATDVDQPAPLVADWPPPAGAILYLPATCGWRNGGEPFGDILRWVSQWRGRVGLNFEVTGSTGNLGVVTSNWRAAYADHAAAIIPIVASCAAAGVPVKLDAINSNDFGKGWSKSWQNTPGNRAAVLDIMGRLRAGLTPYAEWCTVQPVAEDDSSMPADLLAACRRAWAGWPAQRLVGAGLAEHHTGELKKFGRGHLVSTDNPDAIQKHFGRGVWTAHTPNVARCTAYARHYLAQGAHVSLYHRADRLHLLEHRAAYEQIVAGAGISAVVVKPKVPPPSTGLTFVMTGNGEKDVRWSPAIDRSDKKRWPVKQVDGSDCNALLYGARVGEPLRKIEWVKVGDQHAHTKNAWKFKDDRKYNQHWVGGESVTLEVRDINGRVVVAGLNGEAVTR